MRALKRTALLVGLSAVMFGALSLNAAVASATWHPCNVKEVMDKGGRISVLCSNSIALNGNTVTFADLSTSDASRAERYISAANAGLLTGTVLWLDLPATSTTNVSGCAATNCRTPVTYGLGK